MPCEKTAWCLKLLATNCSKPLSVEHDVLAVIDARDKNAVSLPSPRSELLTLPEPCPETRPKFQMVLEAIVARL